MYSKIILSLAFCASFTVSALCQYDEKYVETSALQIDGVNYGVLKMSRKDNRVKVKYFAAKDYAGTSVYDRYSKWKVGRKIVAVSSGTYMTDCNANFAKPVGICTDNGSIVNEQVMDNGFDGLAIVYATGGMAASNLKLGDLTVTLANGVTKRLNIRNSAFDKAEFMRWAQDNQATVFQTHLFVYKNQLTINQERSSKEERERRFLAVSIMPSGEVKHFIVNIKKAYTIYVASQKALEYLQQRENVKEVTFMLNLDPGCQNVYEVYKPDGSVYRSSTFTGQVSIQNAANLIVYYYE